MGWGRTLLLGDIGLRMDIEDTEQDLAALKRAISKHAQKDMSQDEMIQSVLAENARLTLYFVSLVRLLAGKGILSREELYAMVNAVDAEDGVVDQKFSGKSVFPNEPGKSVGA